MPYFAGNYGGWRCRRPMQPGGWSWSYIRCQMRGAVSGHIARSLTGLRPEHEGVI